MKLRGIHSRDLVVYAYVYIEPQRPKMKANIIVLIENTTESIEASLNKALDAHELDWDDDDSIENRHWDYWVFADTNLPPDTELAASFPNERAELLANASFVRNLPDDFTTTGVIGLDGKWIDVDDHGWRMLKEPSAANDAALQAWQQRLREVLAHNREHIGVHVKVHS